MRTSLTFYVAAFFMVVLIFSLPFVTLAQQNSELADAIAAAEQDAKANANQIQILWGCGGFLTGIIAVFAAHVYQPSPPVSRFIGKSPEYVQAYSQAYTAKARNLQLSAAVPGCLTWSLSYIILKLWGF